MIPINNKKRQVAAIILAAGKSQRMGRQKLLLPLNGNTILGKTIENVKRSGINDIVLVLGHMGETICHNIDTTGLKIVINEDYDKGQMTSVKAGLAELHQGFGAMFILGDQPFIDSSVYRKLWQEYQNSDAQIVLPATIDGRRGNPVIFAPELFSEIALIEGDNGPRALIDSHLHDVLTVLFSDDTIHLDIDTPETYEKCVEEDGVK